MSKRKDIEYIHNVKGISYKEARRLYHDNGDDLCKALDLDITLSSLSSLTDTLSEFIKHIAEAAYKIGEAIVEIVNSIDWKEVLDNINNNIEVSDDYFKEDGDNE